MTTAADRRCFCGPVGSNCGERKKQKSNSIWSPSAFFRFVYPIKFFVLFDILLVLADAGTFPTVSPVSRPGKKLFEIILNFLFRWENSS